MVSACFSILLIEYLTGPPVSILEISVNECGLHLAAIDLEPTSSNPTETMSNKQILSQKRTNHPATMFQRLQVPLISLENEFGISNADQHEVDCTHMQKKAKSYEIIGFE